MTSIDSARVLCANLSAAGPDHRARTGSGCKTTKGANTSTQSLGLPSTRWDTTTRSWSPPSLSRQGRVTHTSNLYWTAPAMELSERLVRHTFAQVVFFANSGAEANEAMIKAARRAHYDAGRCRYEFITATNSFHGRTMATVTLTGQPKYHAGFEPMLPGVGYVPYGDLEAMERAVGEHTAAILVEPIQGEGGVVEPPAGYLAGLRELADRTGCYLLFDEVQTGAGRTGHFLAAEHEGVAPDGAVWLRAWAVVCRSVRF